MNGVTEINDNAIIIRFMDKTMGFNFLRRNPRRQCGCIVHLIRPGKREICCGEETELATLRDMAKTSFVSLRTTPVRFLIQDDCDDENIYRVVAGEIPDTIATYISYLKRPVRYYAVRPKETVDDARSETSARTKISIFQRNELRMLAHAQSSKY